MNDTHIHCIYFVIKPLIFIIIIIIASTSNVLFCMKIYFSFLLSYIQTTSCNGKDWNYHLKCINNKLCHSFVSIFILIIIIIVNWWEFSHSRSHFMLPLWRIEVWNELKQVAPANTRVRRCLDPRVSLSIRKKRKNWSNRPSGPRP